MSLICKCSQCLTSRACAQEAFVKRLSEAGYRQAAHERRSTFNYRDLGASTTHIYLVSPSQTSQAASATLQFQEFVFLQGVYRELLYLPPYPYIFCIDTIPQPVSLADALERRAVKEKELLEPAVSAAPSPLPSFTPLPTPLPSAAPSITTSTTKQRRGRSTNGPDETTANANSVSTLRSTASTPTEADSTGRRQSAREPKPRRRHGAPSSDIEIVDDHVSVAKLQNGSSRTRAPRERPSRSRLTVDDTVGSNGRTSHARSVKGQESANPMANGSATGGKSLRGADNFGASHSLQGGTYLPPEYLLAHNGSGQEDRRSSLSPSPSHATHVLHGQFIGPGIPFGRNGLTENPGRTIYSQQRQPNR